MKSRKIFGMLFFMCTLWQGAMAHAGWTSGGGELLQDGHNPWWLSNTPVISYCVLLDTVNFGVSLAVAEEKIEIALAFYKKQLAEAGGYPDGNGKLLQVGQHSFVQVTDCKVADLKFQFGVLDGEQMRYLENPKKFYGVSVRTEYDRASLRGKGFIYLSPEAGPLRAETQVSKIWSSGNGALLFPTLLHELGHVFGLQHGRELPFMEETYVERLFEKSNFDSYVKFWGLKLMDVISNLHIFAFHGIHDSYPMCSVSGSSGSVGPSPHPTQFVPSPRSVKEVFLGVPETHQCLVFRATATQFEVLSSVNADGPFEVIGRAKIQTKGSSISEFPAVQVFLTPEQKVFPNSQDTRVTVAWMQNETQAKGEYEIIKTGEKRNVFLELLPFRVKRIGGILNGNLILDLDLGF